MACPRFEVDGCQGRVGDSGASFPKRVGLRQKLTRGRLRAPGRMVTPGSEAAPSQRPAGRATFLQKPLPVELGRSTAPARWLEMASGSRPGNRLAASKRPGFLLQVGRVIANNFLVCQHTQLLLEIDVIIRRLMKATARVRAGSCPDVELSGARVATVSQSGAPPAEGEFWAEAAFFHDDSDFVSSAGQWLLSSGITGIARRHSSDLYFLGTSCRAPGCRGWETSWGKGQEPSRSPLGGVAWQIPDGNLIHLEWNPTNSQHQPTPSSRFERGVNVRISGLTFNFQHLSAISSGITFDSSSTIHLENVGNVTPGRVDLVPEGVRPMFQKCRRRSSARKSPPNVHGPRHLLPAVYSCANGCNKLDNNQIASCTVTFPIQF